jgi:LacI family transcriptional regulator
LQGVAGTETAIERFESFEIATAKNRVEVDPRSVFEGNYEAETGLRCADQLEAMHPADRPTALLAANDLKAIAMIQRLAEIGWRFPSDLSVVGFDNIPACTWIHRRLTSIAQPMNRLVREALRSCSSQGQ